jgi:hypothetical protein
MAIGHPSVLALQLPQSYHSISWISTIIILFGFNVGHHGQLATVWSLGYGSSRTTYLAECDDPLLGAHDASLDHHKVAVNLAVVGETTHGSNGLLSQIILGGCIVLHNLTSK